MTPALYASDELFLSLTKKSESLKNIPTSVSIVTAVQIKESGARNLAEAVTGVPGLTNGSYGSLGAAGNIMLRGSSAEQVLVLVDGVRINDPATGLVDLSTIPVDSIDRIEIIRGGVSALYGTSAFGGIVNIITKKAEEGAPSMGVDLSAGSFNTQHYGLNFNIKNGNTSGFFSAGKLSSDGWRVNSAYDNNDLFANLGFEDPLWGAFNLSAKQFSSSVGVPGMGIAVSAYDGSLEKQASTPNATQKEDKSSIELGNTKNFDAGTLKSVLHASDSKTDYLVPEWLKNDRYQSTVFGSEIQFAARCGLTAGTEWWGELYRQIDKNSNTAMLDASRTTTAVFLQQEAAYKDLRFIPSARLDNNSIFGTVTSPRMTVLFHAADCLKISANSGKAWRAPTINELYWPKDTNIFSGTTYVTLGNATLKPEEGITSDIGIEYLAQNAKASVTYYLTDSDNLISWDSSVDTTGTIVTTQPMNIGKARQQGVECELSHKIISGLLHKCNYTYLRAEDIQRHTPLVYRPEHTAQYELSYLTVSQTKATVTARFVSAQKTGDPAVPELKEYTTVNCRISQNIKTLELWAAMNNVFDVKYQTRLYYPLPGQTVSAGINWKFQE